MKSHKETLDEYGRPFVSVIIAAYNCGNTLEKAIKSCFLQNVDLEIIIINDASTDNTQEVAEIYTDRQRVFVYSNEKNCGPAYARNRAIRKAKGKWVAQLDGDDWFMPNRLHHLLQIAEKYKADCVADDLYMVDGKNMKLISTRFIDNGAFWKNIREIQPIDIVNFDLGSIKPVIKRELLLNKKIYYPEHFVYGEDFLFLLKLALSGAKICISPIPGYNLRRGETGSLTTNKNHLYSQLIEGLDSILVCNEIKSIPRLFAALKRRRSYLIRLNKTNKLISVLNKKRYLDVAKYLSRKPLILPLLLIRLIEVVQVRINRRKIHNILSSFQTYAKS